MHPERQGPADRAAHRRRALRTALVALSLVVAGCRPRPAAPAPAPAPTASTTIDAGVEAVDAAVEAAPVERAIGPYELPLDAKRKVYYVAPRSTKAPARLIANLHGVCNPPGYACGYWTESASRVGFLVCPEGNTTCGAGGPPTWKEPVTAMDADLEKAIGIVSAEHPGEVGREGAVLTGFSLGAYAAAQIARAHPGRWPYLILTDANVPLDAAQLRAAGVKAVALVAGEIGTQVAGERATAQKLDKQGFPARLWVMKGAGHHYSADVDAIMAEALAWVLAHE